MIRRFVRKTLQAIDIIDDEKGKSLHYKMRIRAIKKCTFPNGTGLDLKHSSFNCSLRGHSLRACAAETKAISGNDAAVWLKKKRKHVVGLTINFAHHTIRDSLLQIRSIK